MADELRMARPAAAAEADAADQAAPKQAQPDEATPDRAEEPPDTRSWLPLLIALFFFVAILVAVLSNWWFSPGAAS